MSKITVQVQVSKSADDLGKAVVDLVKAAKNAAADGWQPMRDVPAVVAAAMSDVLSAASAIPAIPADVAEDKVAFAQGLELRLAEIVRLFV